MKLMRTEDALGQILCHDITQIIRGVTKDVVFKKGHIIREEDIPVLLSVGKDNIYIWEYDSSLLHENDAAEILRRIGMGKNIGATQPKEGKIELIAQCDGILTVDDDRLRAVNGLGEMIIATRHGGFAVKRGDRLAGTRVIPLVIKKEKMALAEKVAGGEPLLNVIPFSRKKIGVVTTGNEVFHGRIEDSFTPVIGEKFREFDSQIGEHVIIDDNPARITDAIVGMLERGMDMVVCTGGMSVDPDDRTPLAIRNSGARVVSYGAPVLPGSMFMLAYAPDGRPVMGLPGCVMYEKRTVFDLVLPYLMADLPVTAEHLAGLGQGGLCLKCDVCRFPDCGFGK